MYVSTPLNTSPQHTSTQTLNAECKTLRTNNNALEREVKSLTEQLKIARASSATVGIDADSQTIASIDALRKQVGGDFMTTTHFLVDHASSC